MSITLTVGAINLPLPEDFYWSDENWQPVVQTSQRAITGALILSASLRLAGRPITLQPSDESDGWLDASTLAQLRIWAAIPGQVLTLNLRGINHTVVFRHEDGPIEATPIVHYTDVAATDFYAATLRFLEIT